MVVPQAYNAEKLGDVQSHEAFKVVVNMLVTGAFGHSRTHDFVIGAARRALPNNAKLPVLFFK